MDCFCEDVMVLGVLHEYISSLPKPKNEYELYFEKYSYTCWAAKELEVYILAHCELTPTQAVSEFREKMLSQCHQKFYKNLRNGREDSYSMYSIAYDLASEVLIVLRNHI